MQVIRRRIKEETEYERDGRVSRGVCRHLSHIAKAHYGPSLLGFPAPAHGPLPTFLGRMYLCTPIAPRSRMLIDPLLLVRYLVTLGKPPTSVNDIAAALLDPTLFCLGSVQDRDASPIPPKVSFWVYRMQEAKG